MSWLRWQTFRVLSFIGWKICPEPHRSRLQAVMHSWDEIDEDHIASACEGALIRELSDINFGSRS